MNLLCWLLIKCNRKYFVLTSKHKILWMHHNVPDGWCHNHTVSTNSTNPPHQCKFSFSFCSLLFAFVFCFWFLQILNLFLQNALKVSQQTAIFIEQLLSQGALHMKGILSNKRHNTRKYTSHTLVHPLTHISHILSGGSHGDWLEL